MKHIVSSFLAKAYRIEAVAGAIVVLAKGAVRGAVWAAPRLAGAAETLLVGVARNAAWDIFKLSALLGSCAARFLRWLDIAGIGRSE